MPTLVTGTGGNANGQSTSTNNSPQQTGDVNNYAGQKASVGNATTTGTTNAAQPTAFAVPTIINPNCPIVVFVGPPASGKSMILVRLAKYLRDNGYTVEADRTFLNTEEYRKDCAEFMQKLDTREALSGTVKFLLVDVYNHGQLIAKLLEAPGEDFYTTDPGQRESGKNNRVEPYLSTIMTSNNPKSYVVLLDLDSPISFRNDTSHCSAYAQRFLRDFYPRIDTHRDRIVLLYNKIDKPKLGTINGCNSMKLARDDAKMYYKALFAGMKVQKFGGFITVDNFTFKTFCTGTFDLQIDNNGYEHNIYNIASDVYPRDLWREVTKRWR